MQALYQQYQAPRNLHNHSRTQKLESIARKALTPSAPPPKIPNPDRKLYASTPSPKALHPKAEPFKEALGDFGLSASILSPAAGFYHEPQRTFTQLGVARKRIYCPLTLQNLQTLPSKHCTKPCALKFLTLIPIPKAPPCPNIQGHRARKPAPPNPQARKFTWNPFRGPKP